MSPLFLQLASWSAACTMHRRAARRGDNGPGGWSSGKPTRKEARDDARLLLDDARLLLDDARLREARADAEIERLRREVEELRRRLGR